MKLLLDTCTIAEFSKPFPDQKVIAFIESAPSESLFLSAISVGEISKGIHLLGPTKRRAELQQWLMQLEQSYQDHIFPINIDVSRIWGEITAEAQKKGKILPAADGLIAATAINYGLHLVTRNVKDFDCSSALLINPWV
ncbi:MAG: type II toxin-antitoxin system VapC family toxin [Gammaproteobacteria bacterium]|jgi:predicted nucleic acid-binding protein|nr:type II toxin-antitoxin system VapC family toxin [Gammaproteobacteria bacterium]